VTTFCIKTISVYFFLKTIQRNFLLQRIQWLLCFANNPMTTFFLMKWTQCLHLVANFWWNWIQWLLNFTKNPVTTLFCKYSCNYFLMQRIQWLLSCEMNTMIALGWIILLWHGIQWPLSFVKNPATTFFCKDSSNYFYTQKIQRLLSCELNPMIALGCKFCVAWNPVTTFFYKESSDYFLLQWF
jgi:hypothetical protein